MIPAPVEFSVSGHSYRAGAMPVRTQFHVTRKLAPAIGRLGPVLRSLAVSGGADEAADATARDAMLSVALPALAEAIAGMSEVDCDFVLNSCLACVQRSVEGGSWSPVLAPRTTQLMFDDIDLSGMVRIAFEVLRAALGPFFAGIPSS